MAPRRPVPGKSAGNPTKLRLILAAEKLHALKGLRGVTHDEITRAAGLSGSGAVKYYFCAGSSQDSIIDEIVAYRMTVFNRYRQTISNYFKNERGYGFLNEAGDIEADSINRLSIRELICAMTFPTYACIGRSPTQSYAARFLMQIVANYPLGNDRYFNKPWYFQVMSLAAETVHKLAIVIGEKEASIRVQHYAAFIAGTSASDETWFQSNSSSSDDVLTSYTYLEKACLRLLCGDTDHYRHELDHDHTVPEALWGELKKA